MLFVRTPKKIEKTAQIIEKKDVKKPKGKSKKKKSKSDIGYEFVQKTFFDE